jgi:hypothetical protein
MNDVITKIFEEQLRTEVTRILALEGSLDYKENLNN